MRLLSDSMLQQLPFYDEVSEVPQSELVLHFHLYNPVGLGDWFVIGKFPGGDDVDLYVLEVLEEIVLRKLSLKDVSGLEFPCGEKIRRDGSFRRITLDELRENVHIFL